MNRLLSLRTSVELRTFSTVEDANEFFGFSRIEYLITFQSIIFGFIATLHLDAWGRVINTRHRVKLDASYMLFGLLVFLVMCIHWWNTYGRASVMDQNLWQFLGMLPYLGIFYFLAVFLFGRIRKVLSGDKQLDLSAAFDTEKNKLYGLLLFFFVYDLFFTIQPANFIFQVAGIGLSIAGLMSRHRRVHFLLLCASLALVVSYLLRDLLLPNARQPDVSYSKVEHLVIFISVIYGYVITVFLDGWARLFWIRRENFSLIQFMWTLFSFLFLIDLWWGSWHRNAFIATDILHFLLLLVVPFLIFLICTLLFPSTGASYQNHFFQNKAHIFFLFALVLAVQMLLSWFFHEGAMLENLMRTIGLFIAVVAIRVRHPRFHLGLVVVSFVLLLVHLYLIA